MTKTKTRGLVMSAMIAAIYTVLSLVLAPIAFGQFQMRVSEALTLLPVFSPWAIVGVALGCLLSNCIGVAMGLTLPMDILFGTLATLLAACATYGLRRVKWKGLPVLASLPPVLFNAFIIGWELTYFLLPDAPSAAAFAVTAFWVGLGEAGACCVLGLLLVGMLQKTGLGRRLFGGG